MHSYEPCPQCGLSGIPNAPGDRCMDCGYFFGPFALRIVIHEERIYLGFGPATHLDVISEAGPN